MPPRKKAATTKRKAEVKEEEPDNVANNVADNIEPAAASSDVKAEEPDSQPATGRRSARKAASTTETTTSTSTVKPAAKGRAARGKAADKTAAAISSQPDELEARPETESIHAGPTPETANATATSQDQKPAPVEASETDQPAVAQPQPISADDPFESTSYMIPAAAPDIAGVVAEREDEDLAVDDTEPPPMDDEEVRRLRERPNEARDTHTVPEPLSGASNMASQMEQHGHRLKQAVASSNAEPVGQEVGIAEIATPSWLETAPEQSMSKEERVAKMNALRKRMSESAQANRREVVAAQNEHRKNIAESKRLERKRKQAEAMGEKLEAMETGEDLERKRNWEYTLEDNERWSKKQDRKSSRTDTGFASFDDSARRKYKRDMDNFKPDLAAYRAQREAVYSASDNAVAGPSNGHDGQLIQTGGPSQLPGADQLYRDANSFVYADHKPSDEAIDRVIGQINQDIDKRAKRSRVRNEEDGDVTYINDRNKGFNKKLERYYTKFTGEITAAFERGTAL